MKLEGLIRCPTDAGGGARQVTGLEYQANGALKKLSLERRDGDMAIFTDEVAAPADHGDAADDMQATADCAHNNGNIQWQEIGLGSGTPFVQTISTTGSTDWGRIRRP